MSEIRIKDIYAGKPDARDEIDTNQVENFQKSFIVPPELPIDSLLDGQKFLISGFKGVGKTAVLYYLQLLAQERDPSTCTSFMYFKSDFEEVRKSNMDSVAKKLTAIIDLSGEIQPNKVEFLHLWRWIFFKKVVDDNEENSNGLFVCDDNWHKFVKEVNKISFSSHDKGVISLSSLSVSVQTTPIPGITTTAEATFESISKNERAFRSLVDTVDCCEQFFEKLERTETPYYIFVDEIEAFYGDKELFVRDLTLIRDLIFTIHRMNSSGKLHIIAAVRNEILYAMDRFVQTRELNKVTDGFGVPLKWSYSNTNSYEHPIIKILMGRITAAGDGIAQSFRDWFPAEIHGKETVNYILDNGWNKPRDIVRFLIAAQNDSLHCNDNSFSQAAFDTLRKEYSRNSLSEIRQELQSLYTSEEIEIVLRLLRGGPRIISEKDIRKKAKKGSRAREFWDSRGEDVLEDFYRVGFWGNVNRTSAKYRWRWNHKDETGVLTDDGWELAIHFALCSELSITSY